jgi:hypothetical protein
LQTADTPPTARRGKLASFIATALLVLAGVAFGLAVGEIALRIVDGYSLTSLRLVRPLPPPPQTEAKAADALHQQVAAIPLAAGMRREWFDLSPEPIPGRDRPDPTLVEATRRAQRSGVGWEIMHVYNTRFADNQDCSEPGSLFAKFPGFVFLFDDAASAYPRYRFPANVVTPTGLATNAFGWRGRQIALIKPDRTIRIAFVGASTTVNSHPYPFSYPALTAFWLNEWLRAHHPNLRIEVINAGREGIGSTDIAAVVRDEVLPLEPDLVVYYEGSNQFGMGNLIQNPPLWKHRRSALKRLARLKPYSAVASRLDQLVRTGADFRRESDDGAEPPKPGDTLVWPQGVDEADPPLDHSNLPVNLTTILRDLGDMEQRVRQEGGELVLSSFFWLVRDGMRLDPVRDRTIYDYLNVTFAPYRYGDMERLAAFQNRTFAKFAASRNIPFVDIAAAMPFDPALFGDAIHATYDGVRLHAWIAAQQLVPILAPRIADGRLPRPARRHDTRHPAFGAAPRTALLTCKQDEKGASARVALTLYASGFKLPPP